MGRIRNFFRNINYLSKHSLWDQREADIVYLTNKILDDAQYEYNLFGEEPKPHVLEPMESTDYILLSNKSFIRTGDGECKIIMGMDQPFQKYTPDLADGLKKILRAENDNILVGINRGYYIPGKMNEYSPFYRRFAFDYRQVYKKYINFEYTYFDAACTSFRIGNKLDVSVAKDIYSKWKEAFKDRDLVIVCGEGILDSLKYDIFELAKSKKYIFHDNTT